MLSNIFKYDISSSPFLCHLSNAVVANYTLRIIKQQDLKKKPSNIVCAPCGWESSLLSVASFDIIEIR